MTVSLRNLLSHSKRSHHQTDISGECPMTALWQWQWTSCLMPSRRKLPDQAESAAAKENISVRTGGEKEHSNWASGEPIGSVVWHIRSPSSLPKCHSRSSSPVWNFYNYSHPKIIFSILPCTYVVPYGHIILIFIAQCTNQPCLLASKSRIQLRI